MLHLLGYIYQIWKWSSPSNFMLLFLLHAASFGLNEANLIKELPILFHAPLPRSCSIIWITCSKSEREIPLPLSCSSCSLMLPFLFPAPSYGLLTYLLHGAESFLKS
jgi:hypothetical protein